MADGPHFTYFPTLISLPESVLPLSSGDGDFGNEIVPTQERSFDETSVFLFFFFSSNWFFFIKCLFNVAKRN